MGERPGCRPVLAATGVAHVRHAAVGSRGTVPAAPAQSPTAARCNNFGGFLKIRQQATTTGSQPAMPARHDVMCGSLSLLEQPSRTE